MYVYFMGSLDVWTGVQSGFSRITTGQMSGLYHYLIIFPDRLIIYKEAFPNPSGIFHGSPIA